MEDLTVTGKLELTVRIANQVVIRFSLQPSQFDSRFDCDKGFFLHGFFTEYVE